MFFETVHLYNTWNINNIRYQNKHSNTVWELMKTFLAVCLILLSAILYNTEGKYYLIEADDGMIFWLIDYLFS